MQTRLRARGGDIENARRLGVFGGDVECLQIFVDQFLVGAGFLDRREQDVAALCRRTRAPQHQRRIAAPRPTLEARHDRRSVVLVTGRAATPQAPLRWFDLRPLFAEDDDPQPKKRGPALGVEIQVAELRVSDDRAFSQVRASLESDGLVWQRIGAEGRVGSEGRFALDMSAADKRHRFHLTSLDAGAMLKSLGFYNHRSEEHRLNSSHT